MAALSDYLEQKLLDHVLRGIEHPIVTDLFVALFTSDPTDAGTGTEVTDSGYSRQSIRQDTATLADAWSAPAPAAGGHRCDNQRRVQFPAIDDGTITVTHFGIFDSAIGGNLLLHGVFDVPKTVEWGDVVSIDVAGIKITMR